MEVKAEAAVDAEAVNVMKEEALSDVVEFGEAWPPLPPLDLRQAFEEEKVDVGVVAAVVVAAPSTPRRPGCPRWSKNSAHAPGGATNDFRSQVRASVCQDAAGFAVSRLY